MKRLPSYLCGEWTDGEGAGGSLVNPATEEPMAEAATAGLDLAAALGFARDRGGAALRGLSFAERGEILGALAAAIHGGREELIDLAIANGGNTRGDAKFDIDGASFTLAHYAELGAGLGDRAIIADGESVQIGRTARLSGQHLRVPRRGVAVHVNAFNFPAWGLAEKAACALLAGMPVLSKPATATALVAHRMFELFVDTGALPAGAMSLLCGGAGDLIDHLGAQDVLAFTGSSDTAARLRASSPAVAHSLHVNVEADSLNASVLAPDVEIGSETEQLFYVDAVRDMTQKAGQKCTAIRRIFVPADRADDIAAELADRLGAVKVGDPATEGVRMGPLATAQQKRDVTEGIARLAAATDEIFGGDGSIDPNGGVGFFVGPVLRRARDAGAAAIHDREVFGPVATVIPYAEIAEAWKLVALGGGGLVASVYSDDRDTLRDAALELGPHHGRLYLGSQKMAAQSPGPGTVLPQLVHGGPGRAGGGEELGSQRGMGIYQQRVALQGDKSILKSIAAD